MAAAFPKAPKKPEEAGKATEAALPLQYSLLLDYLVGEKRGPRPDFPPGALGGFPAPVKSPEQKMVERAMESCAFKAALACVGGFVLGGAFGVFTAGIDTNVGFDPKDPYRTPTAREVLKDMGQRGMSYAKNFAIVGAMFSCTECLVESDKTLPPSTPAVRSRGRGIPLQDLVMGAKPLFFPLADETKHNSTIQHLSRGLD